MSTIIAPPTMPETATTVPQCEARLDQPRNYLNVEHAIKSWLCFGRCAGEKQQQIPETLLAWSGRPRHRPSQKTFSKYRSWITKPTITTKLMHRFASWPNVGSAQWERKRVQIRTTFRSMQGQPRMPHARKAGTMEVFSSKSMVVSAQLSSGSSTRPSESQERSTGRGAQRIFVVDNERTIASSVAAILQLHGFSARFFLDPLEALDAAGCEAPDLLISDVSMPQLSGVDLAIRIQEQYPACKIMLFSGQAATADLLKVAREQGHDFRLLAKPVHPSDLLSELSKPRTLPNLTQNCQRQ
jgi:CheY-like chemotaxis protein